MSTQAIAPWRLICNGRPLVMALLCITLCATGCQSFKRLFKKPPPKSDPIPPTTQIAVEEPIQVTTDNRPVKAGQLPLVYLLEHPGEVRVINATTGVVLVGSMAGGRTILSISADGGVTIGGRTIRPGPLDPKHQYEIYLTVSDENYRKTTYERR